MKFPVPHSFNNRLLPDGALGILLVLPWLNPYTAGPTPNAWPWLISALCAVVLWLFRRGLNARLIAGGWLLAAALSAVIGLVQYFGYAQAFNPWFSQTSLGEAFANLRQRNQLATLLNIGLLALLCLAAQQRLRSQAWGLALLLAVGNAATSSRTGLLELLMVVALVAWWRGPMRARLLRLGLVALAGYAVAAFSLPWLLTLLTGQSGSNALLRLAQGDSLCASRLTLWSNVLTLIAQKPWLGWGWGELDYAHFITLFPGPRFCAILDNAHNLPLHLAVELGVPAAVAICGGLGWVVWRAKPWRETDTARQMTWGVLAVIGLHSLLEYPLWYGPFQIAVALCVGLLWATSSAPAFSPAFKHIRALTLSLQAPAAAMMIALLIAAGIDYHRVSQIYLPPAQRSAAYRDDTLNKIQGAWLFRDQARFAALSLTPLARDNAQWTFDTATALLHYSPESRVVEKLIESATLLGRDEDALRYLARYRAAFPEDHALWAKQNTIR